jgi:type III secretory pathway component EscR
MNIWEIILIIVVSIFVLSVLGIYIYKKINNLPTGECSQCAKGSKKLLKQYRKYQKKNNQK